MNSHGQGVVAKRKNCFRPSSKCKKSRSGRAPSGFSWQGVKRTIHLSVFFPQTQTDTRLFYRTRPPLVICKFAHEPFPPSLVILPAVTVICNSQHFTSNKGPAQRSATKEGRQWANKLEDRLNNCGLPSVWGITQATGVCGRARVCVRDKTLRLCVCSRWQQTRETKVSQLRGSPANRSCCCHSDWMQVPALSPWCRLLAAHLPPLQLVFEFGK